MQRVFRITGKGKVKDVGLRGLAEHPEVEGVDATVAATQALLPLGLGAARAPDAGLFRKILLGLSCRDYAACAEAGPAAFGLSPSSVSHRFIRASARKLQALQERRLDADDVVALVLDGKTCAEDAMVIALGITLTGEKVLLGLVQTATKNERVCAAFLRALPVLRAALQGAIRQQDTTAGTRVA